jgi:hypothetical protein
VGEEEEKSMAGLPAVLVAALSVLFALLGEKNQTGDADVRARVSCAG